MIFWYTIKTKFSCDRVADINPGPADAVKITFGLAPRRQYAHEFGERLYFQADDSQSGAELWRTTETGAELVADIEPGPAGSAPHAFTQFNGDLYFAATTSADGQALFRYDGVSVSLAADFARGPQEAEINGLTVYDGAIYFTLRFDGEPLKVWRFDGAIASPVDAINQVNYVSLAGRSQTFTPFKGRLYYIAEHAYQPGPHYQLWCYDGTTAKKIKDLTVAKDITTYGFDLGVFDNALYFGVVALKEKDVDYLYQDELWRYDGQSPPTKVSTLTNANSSAYSFSQPHHFTTMDDHLYFNAGVPLFRFDGTVLENVYAGSSTVPLHAYQLTTIRLENKSALFMSGFFNDWTTREPYIFDGTEAKLLKNIMPDEAPYPGSFPTFATQVGDSFFFYAEDQRKGRELWKATSSNVFEIQALLIPIWEDKFKWPVREGVQELVLATYLVSGDDPQPRLLGRNVIQLPRTPDQLAVPVVRVDQQLVSLPKSFAVLSVVFDRKREDRLDIGVQAFGVSADAVRGELERRATAYGHRVEFHEVMATAVAAIG